MSGLDAWQRAVVRVCLEGTIPDAALAALGGDPRRWQVYRDLVRNRLWSALLEALPGTFAVAGTERFGGWFTRFLEVAPPEGRFLREVAPGFAAWVRSTEGEALTVPSPWLPDALSLDLAKHHVALSAARLDPARLVPFEMDLPAAFDPVHRRVRTHWTLEGSEAIERPRALLLYRDAARHSVETLVLSPIAADLVDAMDDGTTSPAAAVRAVLSRDDLAAGTEFVESFAGLLGDLIDRGILQGSLSPT